MNPTWRLRRILFALLTLLGVGCTQRAQVLVLVDAEPEVQNRTDFAHLHVYVRTGEAITNDTPFAHEERIDRPSNPPRPGGPTWPVRIVLTPTGDNLFFTPNQRYEVIVGAHRTHDDAPPAQTLTSASIVTTRARSGYVRGETRVLQLRLEAGCIGNLCGVGETCRGGTCRVVDTIDPGSLPTLATYDVDAGPADAHVPPGTDAFGLDAWTSMASDAGMDVGIDAFVEPGVDVGIDAFEEPDAGTDAYAPDAFMLDASAPALGRFTTFNLLPAAGAPFNLGWSVATSDFNIIAVGAPGASDYLYDLTGSPVTPLTNEMDLTCGQSAAINAAGDLAAFGCPTSQFAVWTRSPLAGIFPGAPNVMGPMVAMNATGTLLVLGDSSNVSVARRESTWMATITPFIGVTLVSLDVSDDGMLLVVGLRNGDAPEWNVRTFTLDGTTLTQIGTDLEGDSGFGAVVAMSGDKTTLAVTDSTSATGPTVTLYRRVGTEWVFMRTLATDVRAGLFGVSLAVNANGTRIAVGASFEGTACFGLCPAGTSSTAMGTGAVYVYDAAGGVVNYIRPPDNAGSAFGHSVALNRAGTRLVIGEPSRPGGGAVYVVE